MQVVMAEPDSKSNRSPPKPANVSVPAGNRAGSPEVREAKEWLVGGGVGWKCSVRKSKKLGKGLLLRFFFV